MIGDNVVIGGDRLVDEKLKLTMLGTRRPRSSTSELVKDVDESAQ